MVRDAHCEGEADQVILTVTRTRKEKSTSLVLLMTVNYNGDTRAEVNYLAV